MLRSAIIRYRILIHSTRSGLPCDMALKSFSLFTSIGDICSYFHSRLLKWCQRLYIWGLLLMVNHKLNQTLEHCILEVKIISILEWNFWVAGTYYFILLDYVMFWSMKLIGCIVYRCYHADHVLFSILICCCIPFLSFGWAEIKNQ
jgi:hypothetical protein